MAIHVSKLVIIARPMRRAPLGVHVLPDLMCRNSKVGLGLGVPQTGCMKLAQLWLLGVHAPVSEQAQKPWKKGASV